LKVDALSGEVGTDNGQLKGVSMMRWIVLSGLMGGLWLCAIGCNKSSTIGNEDTEMKGAETDTAETDADSDADGDVDTDTDADVDGDTDTDVDGDTDTDADGDTDTDADGDTDTDADGDTDTDADGDTDTDVDGDTDSDGDADSDSDSDTDADLPGNNFTEEVGGVSFDMVYIPGGTFTLGCESDACPETTAPVPGVTVSSYHIAKNEVTTELWNAVMGDSRSGSDDPGSAVTSITWYDALSFACELSQITGRNYRMVTEAEWEFAAKNFGSSLKDIGGGEEWAYNSWSNTHTGGTDPVGPNSGAHTQKTRRDPEGTVDSITGRLIRSIDGIGPALRLAVSAEMDFPPDYVPPCDMDLVCLCSCDGEPENSYRDPRWGTGGDARWTQGASGIVVGDFDLRVWEDGTATLNGAEGQWFTSNNIAFVFVPSTGDSLKFPYIFLDEAQASVISDKSYMNGGLIFGEILKESAGSSEKPTLSDLKTGEALAAAAGDDYKMIDMANISDSAKEQDERLIDGPGRGWFQDNTDFGAVYHYRNDIDSDEFRLAVYQDEQRVMLAAGEWFTVGNTFLRITHADGYITDYLYTLTSDGYLFHLSYQRYELGDFRMFRLKDNSESFPVGCDCSDEIPKGETLPIFSDQEDGRSTFIPATCPADGCK
jgi:hypothetical protein